MQCSTVMEMDWGRSRYKMEDEHVMINNKNRSKKRTWKRSHLLLAESTALLLDHDDAAQKGGHHQGRN